MNIAIPSLILLCTAAHAYDWDGIPVPADPGPGKVWRLLPASDDFNYNAPAGDKMLRNRISV